MPRKAVFPKGLKVRGKRLWQQVLEIRPRLGPGERVLLEEACRLTDRLEALNDEIAGRKAADVVTKDGRRFVLVVDAAMQEARLTTIALRQVMMSLGLDKMPVPEERPPAPAEPVPEPAGEADGEPGGLDPIDEIGARRGKRDAAAG